MPAPGQPDEDHCPICRELMLRLSGALRQLGRINTAISGALIEWELGISPEPDSTLVDSAQMLREEAANARAELQNHRALHHGAGVASRSKTAMP